MVKVTSLMAHIQFRLVLVFDVSCPTKSRDETPYCWFI